MLKNVDKVIQRSAVWHHYYFHVQQKQLKLVACFTKIDISALVATSLLLNVSSNASMITRVLSDKYLICVLSLDNWYIYPDLSHFIISLLSTPHIKEQNTQIKKLSIFK